MPLDWATETSIVGIYAALPQKAFPSYRSTMDTRIAGRMGGRIGGKSRSKAKLAAVKRNLKKAQAARHKKAKRT